MVRTESRSRVLKESRQQILQIRCRKYLLTGAKQQVLSMTVQTRQRWDEPERCWNETFWIFKAFNKKKRLILNIQAHSWGWLECFAHFQVVQEEECPKELRVYPNSILNILMSSEGQQEVRVVQNVPNGPQISWTAPRCCQNLFGHQKSLNVLGMMSRVPFLFYCCWNSAPMQSERSDLPSNESRCHLEWDQSVWKHIHLLERTLCHHVSHLLSTRLTSSGSALKGHRSCKIHFFIR